MEGGVLERKGFAGGGEERGKGGRRGPRLGNFAVRGRPGLAFWVPEKKMRQVPCEI